VHGLGNSFYAALESAGSDKRWLDFYAGGSELIPAELSALQTHIADRSVHQQTYTHTQQTPAMIWTINHNLGRYPDITLLESNGDEFIAEVHHVTINQVTVNLVIPFTGIAQCN
jgi:hypothetical protein